MNEVERLCVVTVCSIRISLRSKTKIANLKIQIMKCKRA